MSADDPKSFVTEGEFTGWQRAEPGDTFNGLIGAYYYETSDPANTKVAFKAEKRHLNGGGSVHGGCLLTLADTALFVFALPVLGEGSAVTMQLDAQFLAPGREGDVIVATGEIVRAGRTVIFGRGELRCGDRVLMSFTGILARKTPRGHGDG